MTDETLRSDEYDDIDSQLESIALPPRPAIWPVFATFGVMLASIFCVQVVLGMVLAVWLLANGVAVDQMPARVQEWIGAPWPFLAVSSLTQSLIAAIGIGAAWLSRESWSESLGLHRAGLSGRELAVVTVGSLAPALLGSLAADALARVLEPDQTIARVCAQTTWETGPLFILFIALAPAFSEELAFRGYIQRRLLQRWPPWAAIPLTSLLFGILHLSPHSMLNALVIGLWLGIVAWRTNSVWPGVVCHAFINAWAVSWPVGHALGLSPEEPPTAVTIAAGAVGVLCCCLSLWILFRKTPAMLRADEPSSPASP